jgi:drug/metabolite transporter (DMT)-like permease
MTLVYGLGAALGWALADLFAARSSRALGAVGALFWILLAGLPPLLVLALATGEVGGAMSRHDLGIAVLVGFGDVVAYGLFLLALKLGELAIIGPLAATSGGFAAAGGFLLGASVDPLALAAIPLAVFGAALAALAPGARGTVAGLAPALGAAAVAAGILVLLGQVHHLGAVTTILVARIAALIVVAPLAAARGALRIDLDHRWLVLAAGALDSLGLASYAAAASLGPVPIAAVTATQAAPITAIIGITVLRERPARHQLAGIVLTVLAVSLLALGGSGA